MTVSELRRLHLFNNRVLMKIRTFRKEKETEDRANRITTSIVIPTERLRS